MLSLFIFIAFFLAVIFRWWWLAPILGSKHMYLFDAVMWTCWAAWQFSQSGPLATLGFIFGILGLWWAYQAGRNYLKFEEVRV